MQKKTLDSVNNLETGKYNQNDINFDSTHVVFKSAIGNILFGQKSNNCHVGCEVLGEFPNFQEANDFVEKYKSDLSTPQY